MQDPAFMDSLKDKGGEGRVLYDKLNPFGKQYANSALSEGVVEAYNAGITPALLQDDQLLKFPENDAEGCTAA